MSIRFAATAIPGVLRVESTAPQDERGDFIKTFQRDEYAAAGLAPVFAETYHSRSRRDVVRGMHFQLPPHAHDKLVWCMNGRVLDAVVDLRRGSPAFGSAYALELDARVPVGVWIPAGCAHGFLALRDDAVVSYAVTSTWAPDADAGVRWDSIGIDWGVGEPIVSARDAAFPVLADFDSPFAYEEAAR